MKVINKIIRFGVILFCSVAWLLTRLLFWRASRTAVAKQDIQRVIILAWGGIGNLILFTPVLKNLKRHFPLAEVVVIVNPNGSGEVISGSPWVNRIVEQQDGGLRYVFGQARSLRLKDKKAMFISMVGIDPLKAAMYALFSGSQYRVGELGRLEGFFHTHTIMVRPKRHEVLRNLDLLRRIGIDITDEEVSFWLPEETRVLMKRELEGKGIAPNKILVLAPGSGRQQEYKRWPKEYFAQVARWAITKGLHVFLLGDASQSQLCEDIRVIAGNSAHNMAGKWSLKQTAALVSLSALAVSNDNALMHVASVFKVPLVAIFGPTLYYKNAPWKTMARIVKLDLPCVPCYNFQDFSCRFNNRCLTQLYPQQVIAAIEELAGQTKCFQ